VWHGVILHDHVLSIRVVYSTPGAFSIVVAMALEVVGEPAMS